MPRMRPVPERWHFIHQRRKAGDRWHQIAQALSFRERKYIKAHHANNYYQYWAKTRGLEKARVKPPKRSREERRKLWKRIDELRKQKKKFWEIADMLKKESIRGKHTGSNVQVFYYTYARENRFEVTRTSAKRK